MTDFNKQLVNMDGEPSTQSELKMNKETKKAETTVHELTILRCSKFALLDIAKTDNGMEHELNQAHTMHKRYKLWKKIEVSPENVELSVEDKDLLSSLLCYHYDVVIVGQIMELL